MKKQKIKKELKLNSTKYKNQYKKEHYIRKELNFTKEQWLEIDKYLKNLDVSSKELVLKFIKEK